MNHLEEYAWFIARKELQDKEIESAKERHKLEIEEIKNRYRVGEHMLIEDRIAQERERIADILYSSGRKEISDDFGWAQRVTIKRFEIVDESEMIDWLLIYQRHDLVKQEIRKREFFKVYSSGIFDKEETFPDIVEVIDEELRIHITKQVVE